MNSIESKKRKNNDLLGQPKGLFVLFFTELWERMSFYGMKSILVLFLTKSVSEGGWMMEKSHAYLLNGIYSFLVYSMCIPAGRLADRYIGARLAVLWGAALQCIGHLLLGITAAKVWFICGIWFLALGTGLLKTNISSMVGFLYGQEDKRREKGFSIFYQGINIGSIFGLIVVPAIKDMAGFHAGFMAAGIGMIFSFIIFAAGLKYTGAEPNAYPNKKRISLFIPAIAFLGTLILLVLSRYVEMSQAVGFLAITNKALSFSLIVILFTSCILVWSKTKNKIDKSRIAIIYMTFFAIVSYVVLYMQTEGLFVKFAEEKVNRVLFLFGRKFEIGPAYFQVLNPIFIVMFGYPIAIIWQKIKEKRPTSVTAKLGIGLLFFAFNGLVVKSAIGFAQKGSISMGWLVLMNLLIVLGELCIMVPGLSFISEMAPKSLKSTIMGICWGFVSLGSILGGEVSSFASKSVGHANLIFWILFLSFGTLGLVYLGLNNYTYRLLLEKGKK